MSNRKRSVPDNRLPLPRFIQMPPCLVSELRYLLKIGEKCPTYPPRSVWSNRMHRSANREASDKRNAVDHQRMVEEGRRKRVDTHLRANAACRPSGGWNRRYLNGMHTNISSRCA